MKMDLLPYNNENLLINFPPLLRKNFEELFRHGKIGLINFTLNDISFTKQYKENNSTYTYYYNLKIPYAGKRLSWDLIFNPEDMTFAPDFNFNDDSFFMSHDLNLIINNIPSLLNWNVNESKSLMFVLTEFLNLFKKQQLQKLNTENIYSLINTEYEQLIEEVISGNDVEVYLENNSAHFTINLKVDVTSLPEFTQLIENDQCVLMNPGEDDCILKVSFMKLDLSRVNTSLQLSPRLEQVLGGTKSIHIPNYTKQNSLKEYVSSTLNLLRERIKRIEEHYKYKKEYILCLYTLYASNLIEYDSENYSKAELMCAVNDCHCLVYIEIDRTFPLKKPTVTLQSLYCMTMKQPCLEVLEDYPFSPRWEPNVMLERLMTHLTTAIPEFMNHKH